MENKTEPKSKGQRIGRKGKQSNKKRTWSMDAETFSASNSDNDSQTKNFCEIYKVAGGSYWNHKTVGYGTIKYFKKFA